MNVNEVIKYPILSEKTYAQMANGVYTFAVDRRTNKSEVKKVIKLIFEVKVAKVNVLNVAKKPKSLGRFKGFSSAYKKAIVYLKQGEQINIFPEEAKQKPVEAKKEKVTQKATLKISDAEKRAAAKIAAKTQAKTTSEQKEKVQVKAEPTQKQVVSSTINKQPTTKSKEKIDPSSK